MSLQHNLQSGCNYRPIAAMKYCKEMCDGIVVAVCKAALICVLKDRKTSLKPDCSEVSVFIIQKIIIHIIIL